MTVAPATNGPARSRNRERTRAALIDAAARVFARKGFAAASLDEIAEAAGYTRGAVHHHFASKEEMFLAAIARRDEELLAGYDPGMFGARPENVVAGAVRWRELHADDTDEVALRLELRSQALRNDELREQLIAVDDVAVAATTAALVRSVEAQDGHWRLPPSDVAQLLHVMSRGLAERAALAGTDTSALMGAFIEMVWNESIELP